MLRSSCQQECIDEVCSRVYYKYKTLKIFVRPEATDVKRGGEDDGQPEEVEEAKRDTDIR